MANILEYETVALKGRTIEIIDQTLLPGKTVIKVLSTKEEFYDAIYRLEVRGAPAIGVFAAFAIYLEALRISETCKTYDKFIVELKQSQEYLNGSRPTAVNLSWALNRMMEIVCSMEGAAVEKIVEALKHEAEDIKESDTNMCKAIGEHALTLVQKGDGLLTHCNAGQLATSKYGTATSVMYLGHERGYGFRIYCDETRPLLQGARLTAYELSSAGLDVTLLCDNMVASLMAKGKINAVFVGADRIAANGDTANKIGTSVVATVAKYYGIPFYVCAPSSTIDPTVKSGADIPIEMRNSDEVTQMWYEKRMAPEEINVYNPAFDVTDNSLISAIITEKGIFRTPFSF